jgi:predicted nucleic acid-binding protein
VIVADTGAIIALIDRSERNHRILRELYETDPHAWTLPWAILPEVDYLLATHVSHKAQEAFLADLAEGTLHVTWGEDGDVDVAQKIIVRHRALRLGLVDAVVMATAIRLGARAIATLDVRHFSAVALPGHPKLFPRDVK